IMETIAEQWEIIKAYEGKIPLIEMDIFMANIRKLYDDFYLLEKINKTPGFDSDKIRSRITRESSFVFEIGSNPKPAVNEVKEEPVHHVEPQIESSPEDEKEPELEMFIPDEPENFSHPEPASESPSEPGLDLIGENMPDFETDPEPLSQPAEEPEQELDELLGQEPEEEPEDEPDPEITPESTNPAIELYHNEPETSKAPAEQPVLRKPLPAPLPDLFGSAPTLADKYQADKKSVNDHLTANGNDNSLGNRMQQSQISDLKSAIGINDKFLFINELFKGDLAGYNRAIENLNACQMRQEALDKLDTMRTQFNWSENSTSLTRLNEFLKRRYSI
ncbi:MAG: hypothetical protein IH597_13110, partial [Bacteroidales bacterium]|nr:hypothetical protein [Bacteroidales bacterium]